MKHRLFLAVLVIAIVLATFGLKRFSWAEGGL
jgi:hypothetical protein